MVVSQAVMDALKAIGLNLYERKIWVALLGKGTATAGELSEIANVPRSRAYDILQSLATKGFVMVQGGKPMRFVAIPPAEAFERAKKRLEEEFRAKAARIDEIKNSRITEELNKLYQQGLKYVEPEEITGALKGTLLRRQLETMLKGASKKINILTTPGGLKELVTHHLRLLREARERGVEIRIAAKIPKRYADIVKPLLGIAEIRNINDKEIPINGRFAIIDGKEILFNLTDLKEVHSGEDLAIWSKSEHAAKDVLEPIFNLIWSNSQPLKSK